MANEHLKDFIKEISSGKIKVIEFKPFLSFEDCGKGKFHFLLINGCITTGEIHDMADYDDPEDQEERLDCHELRITEFIESNIITYFAKA